MISLTGKTKLDLTGLRKFEKKLQALCSKQVESGFFDDPHYSGMTTAQLMTIHEFGYGKLPQRNAMLTSYLSFKYDYTKYIKNVYRSVMFSNASIDAKLNYLGNKYTETIKFTIDAGTFSNPVVSKSWADVKGFSEALIHYGELRDSARNVIVPSGYTFRTGRF